MRRILFILFVVFLATGCVRQQTTGPISFLTEDGFLIFGDYYEGGEKAIILLHMLNKDRATFSSLAAELNKNNYTVLAIDIRGHGQSVMQNNEQRTWREFNEDDFNLMTNDVKAAKEFLKSKDKKIVIIGASIGANVALNYAVTDSDVKALILLSPGLNYRGVDTQETIKSYENPIMLVSAEGDAYSADTVKYMYFFAAGKKQLVLFNNSVHGTDMLADTDLDKRIITWLEVNFV